MRGVAETAITRMSPGDLPVEGSAGDFFLHFATEAAVKVKSDAITRSVRKLYVVRPVG